MARLAWINVPDPSNGSLDRETQKTIRAYARGDPPLVSKHQRGGWQTTSPRITRCQSSTRPRTKIREAATNKNTLHALGATREPLDASGADRATALTLLTPIEGLRHDPFNALDYRKERLFSLPVRPVFQPSMANRSHVCWSTDFQIFPPPPFLLFC